MKKILFIIINLTFVGGLYSQDIDQVNISNTLNKWHQNASTANGEGYFALLSNDAIYIGTDKTELWTKSQFEAFAKPYFDAGKAWDFKTISRNIYFSEDKSIAWFDELLDTWMGICRGSGVLEKTDGAWLLKHYHLSVTVPNDRIQDFIKVTSSK